MTEKVEKIEKQRVQIERSKRNLQAREIRHKVQQRKLRTRQLIEWGGLIVKAELEEYGANLLLGAFLNIKEQLNENPDLALAWQQQGGALFNLDKISKSAVIVTLKQPAQLHLKAALRNIGLRWNSIRQEWHGYTNLNKLKDALQNIEAVIEEIDVL